MMGPGDEFAGYRIRELLGRGGMGEVYLADHPRLPRRDALKILTNEVSADPDFRQRFVREAEHAARLWHPNVVAVHDRGEHSGQLWIAMDYVEGTDAAQLLARYPVGLPAGDAAAIVIAIAGALDYAHGQGLLHRDVKPANILIAGPGNGSRRYLLADFGIARRVDEVSGLTATGMTMGTVAYAAPEQLMGRNIDARADQYALAATAFHLFTGRALYANTNAAATISAHLTATPPRPSGLRPDLAALDLVFERALAKDAAVRFPNCAAFAAELTSAGEGARPNDPTRTAVAAEPPTIASSRSLRSHRWLPAAAAAGLAVALAATGAVTLYINRADGASPSEWPAMEPIPEGTYKFAYEGAKRSINGVPTPKNSNDATFWALKASCKPSGCVGAPSALDNNNPTAMRTPLMTTV